MKGSLQDLIDTLGADITLKFVEVCGGSRVIVPASKITEHDLIAHLGQPGFDLLWEAYRGEVLYVPIARAWRIGIYAQLGLTKAEIAKRIGCNENTVYVHLKRQRVAAQQLTFSF